MRNNKLIVFFLLYLVNSILGRPSSKIFPSDNAAAKVCGYESCTVPKSNMLNVHIVPHTHDDVGWLKTVDQYYYGSKSLIQKAGVQYILDSVIQELLKDPKKKFIYVESAFFFKWWSEQTEELQEQVKELVNEGRLEFIGGAWSMNDEATTHYQSIIDQFAWGLRRLNDTFGKCGRPRIGWQIDPFGHAREMASIFAHMGYDGLFFSRLDWNDKGQRLKAKTGEMIWRASANLGEAAHLFTGVLYNHYSAPPGFCFDVLCNDEPIIDGKHSPDNNINRRVSEFLDFVNKQRKYYRTNNIILTMGDDFNFMDAGMYFKNLDKLIRYVNERQTNGSDVNLFYSTPSCYLKYLHDSGITWPTKDDDFFPYATDPHSFWTGYYTSRPTLKRFERVGNHLLQVCKQLSTFASKQEHKGVEAHLNFLRETMGIMQHHDAITGTEKEKVAYDYAKLLDVSFKACSSNAQNILNQITTKDTKVKESRDHPNRSPYKFDFESCLLTNISQCEVSEKSDQFVVTVYNPLAHSTFEYIRIPVSGAEYEVFDYKGVSVPLQIIPIPDSVKNLRFRRSNAVNELVFLASELPPLGYKSYYVTKKSDKSKEDALIPEVIMVMDDPNVLTNEKTVIGNKYINLTFDENGLLSQISSNGIIREVSQNFLYYEGAAGNNMEFQNRSSGAYIFRPNNTVRYIAKRASLEVVRGPLVEEVHQVFNEWVSQVVRVHKDENFAEFEWLVGPIPVDDKIGKEIITRFESNIKSDGIFYTDSNGREMIKRKRDHRDTWDVKLLEKEAGNYYPLTTKIALQDQDARLAILVDRAQGGSSLKDGSLEIMVHRRLLHDDAFGVGEALNEVAYGNGLVARGRHYLFLGPTKSSSPTMQAQERFVQLEKLLPSWVFLSDASKHNFNNWMENYRNIFSAIPISLPQNVHLMTLEPWHENELLIRFEHILEKDEDPEYSKAVELNLKDILKNLEIVDICETTLDGNLLLKDSKRLSFQIDPAGTVYEVISDEDINEPYIYSLCNKNKNLNASDKVKRSIEVDITANDQHDDIDYDLFKVTLQPMQIRTFIVTFK